MISWSVSDIRWASIGALRLPFWRRWNDKNRLPGGFWQRIWEYPYVASRVPRKGSSLDVGGTYPFVLPSSFPEARSIDIRDLNALNHPFHRNKWPPGKQIVADAARMPLEDASVGAMCRLLKVHGLAGLPLIAAIMKPWWWEPKLWSSELILQFAHVIVPAYGAFIAVRVGKRGLSLFTRPPTTKCAGGTLGKAPAVACIVRKGAD